MIKICTLLFLLFYTSACLKNDVVPLEFEDSGKEQNFVTSDNNIIVLPESKEISIQDLYSSEERFDQSKENIEIWINGKTHTTVKRYHCNVNGRGHIRSRGTFYF